MIEQKIKHAKQTGKMWEEVPVIEFDEPEEITESKVNLASMPEELFHKASEREYQDLLDEVPLLRKFSNYILQTTDRYSPVLTLGTGISLLGLMGSNLIQLDGNRSNMYVCAVAQTGFGKDVIKRAGMIRMCINGFMTGKLTRGNLSI